LLILLIAAPAAHAELYRWVDPQTGSVKYSSSPPPWYADPAAPKRGPKVEVVPYKGPALVTRPAEAAADKPAAKPAAEIPPQAADAEERWRELFETLDSFAAADFDRPTEALRQQMAAFEAASIALDRLDPAGAPRRRVEDRALRDRMRR
jgi:hypothetical protein